MCFRMISFQEGDTDPRLSCWACIPVIGNTPADGTPLRNMCEINILYKLYSIQCICWSLYELQEYARYVYEKEQHTATPSEQKSVPR